MVLLFLLLKFVPRYKSYLNHLFLSYPTDEHIHSLNSPGMLGRKEVTDAGKNLAKATKLYLCITEIPISEKEGEGSSEMEGRDKREEVKCEWLVGLLWKFYILYIQ